MTYHQREELKNSLEKIVATYGNGVDSQGMADGFDECVESLLQLFEEVYE